LQKVINNRYKATEGFWKHDRGIASYGDAKHTPSLFTKAFSYNIQFTYRTWSVRIMSYMEDVLVLHQDLKYHRHHM
jgi:hypothetical protein